MHNGISKSNVKYFAVVIKYVLNNGILYGYDRQNCVEIEKKTRK